MNNVGSEAQRIAKMVGRFTDGSETQVRAGACGGWRIDERFITMTHRERRGYVRIATFPQDHDLPRAVRTSRRRNLLRHLADDDEIADLVVNVVDGDLVEDEADDGLPPAMRVFDALGQWFGYTHDAIDKLHHQQALAYRRGRQSAATRKRKIATIQADAPRFAADAALAHPDDAERAIDRALLPFAGSITYSDVLSATVGLIFDRIGMADAMHRGFVGDLAKYMERICLDRLTSELAEDFRRILPTPDVEARRRHVWTGLQTFPDRIRRDQARILRDADEQNLRIVLDREIVGAVDPAGYRRLARVSSQRAVFAAALAVRSEATDRPGSLWSIVSAAQASLTEPGGGIDEPLLEPYPDDASVRADVAAVYRAGRAVLTIPVIAALQEDAS